MQKIIFNYQNQQRQAKRMSLYRNTAVTASIVYAMLYLHQVGLITLNNVLSITEVLCVESSI